MRTGKPGFGIAWVAAIALSLVACGGRAANPEAAGASGGARDSGAGADAGVLSADAFPGPHFPLGTYGTCSIDAVGPGGWRSGEGNGFTLTLSQIDAELTATYDGGGSSGSLDFTVTTATSANLAPSGQPLPGGWTFCGGGVDEAGAIADPVQAEAVLNITSGALTFNSSTLFLSIVGEIILPDGGVSCSGGQVTAAFTCNKE